jgi:hypothetical protein
MGNHISYLYCGGVPIQSHLRKLREDTTGGITTYVMLMLGLVFILYMFGFDNMWNIYTASEIGNTTISDSTLATGVNIMSILVKLLTDNLVLVGGGIFATAILLFIGKITGTAATMLQFLIPVLLMIALNIFVFPVGELSPTLVFMGFGIPTFLFIFFNAFYILAVIEFVRGNA